MNTGEHQAFTAYIGIDWADRKHDVCIQPAKGGVDRIFRWIQSMLHISKAEACRKRYD